MFYVCKCPSCGKISTKEIRKSIRSAIFKCVYCNKSRKFHDRRKGFLSIDILYKTDYCVEAQKVCTELKNQKGGEVVISQYSTKKSNT